MVQIQLLSSQLEVENTFLNSERQQCERNYNDAVAKAANDLELKQKAHDDQVGVGTTSHMSVLYAVCPPF